MLSGYAALEKARKDSASAKRKLDGILCAGIQNYTSEDTNLIVFGSLGRGEWTSGSDLDWTYLIDGQANSDHLRIAQRIEEVLQSYKVEFPRPGQTGTFGNIAFSHDLIHQIGGQQDTNKNTTQRILLLLESGPIGRNTGAYERVVRGVINRYLEEDNHLLARDSSPIRYPVFFSTTLLDFGER